LKKILYIIILIAGFQFNTTAQSRPLHFTTDAVKTIKFYPNPASSFINFDFSKNYDQSYTLVIFNFIGKKIEDLKVTDQKMTVSLTDFYRGVYIFQLRDKDGNVVESGKFQVIK
jgi:type IX secretion system substrate protein